MSHWTAQASRFAGVGLLSTLVHVTAAWFANLVPGMNPFAANLIGFACAFWISYLSNFYWTFGKRGDHAMHLRRFFIASALCFLLSNAIVFTTGTLLQQPFAISLLAIAILIPPLSFALAKFWAFRERPAGNISPVHGDDGKDAQNVLPS